MFRKAWEGNRMMMIMKAKKGKRRKERVRNERFHDKGDNGRRTGDGA